MSILGDNIRKYRKLRGFSQEQIAEQMGRKSFSTVQRWEDGSTELTMAQLAKLAHILGVSINDLIGDEPYVYEVDDKDNNPLSLAEKSVDIIYKNKDEELLHALMTNDDIYALVDAILKLDHKSRILVMQVVSRMSRAKSEVEEEES